MKFARVSATALLLLTLFSDQPPAAAQGLHDPLEPATTGGLERVDRGLAKLTGHRRLLVIAAHPDDEDTGLLTLVATGEGGEAAYLALNRGEGGQNLIGPELGVGLGLIRSQELLAARRIDGARQFFTRAYDFGFTRSLEETFERWPEAALEEDAIRVIRRFRPQVILSVFPPTPAAGHGQHQAAGVIAGRVFDLAGDPQAAPQLLPEGSLPWTPQALYRSGWFDRDAPATETDLGRVDPFTGRSLAQIARASRSSHRSQDMGRVQELGSPHGRLLPVAGNARPDGEDPFVGVDTRLRAIAAGIEDAALKEQLETRLDEVQALAEAARDRLSPETFGDAAESLETILGLLHEARRAVARPAEAATPQHPGAAHAAAFLDEKIAAAEEALAAAVGVAVDATTERRDLIPGESLEVSIEVWNSAARPVQVSGVDLRLPGGWDASPVEPSSWPHALEPGEVGAWHWRIDVPAGADPSFPYFLRQPMDGDLYDWTGVPPTIKDEPFGPPVLGARVRLDLGPEGQRAAPVQLEREVVERYGDQARGEVRHPLRVLPPIEVAVAPDTVVWPVARQRPLDVEVRLTNHRDHPIQGTLEMTVPTGWPAVAPTPFSLAAGGDQKSLQLSLDAPPDLAPGSYRVAATAVVEGNRYQQSAPAVEYEHIRPTLRPQPVVVAVHAGDVVLPDLKRVGYVRGASDRVPEALKSIGLPLTLLGDEELAVGDLSVYDVIVIGSRAYESDPTLGHVNGRLLDYVRGGGRLVVQYQQYAFVDGGFAPYPLTISRPHDRITDEMAPVTVLPAGRALMSSPNVIGPADWDGWVQERGLYFAGTWDDAYTPLLEMIDPEGKALRGGLLEAKLGEGTYVYTGLSFFRQLPAGVVGAYRLFLNLLAETPEG
ncbi:MAG: PIG-L family deacetylase [Acidobacteria bacterium]|nr:PIG-L family deacetylase [Acidobacteriota bacterium]